MYFVLCVICAALLVTKYDLLKISSSSFHFWNSSIEVKLCMLKSVSTLWLLWTCCSRSLTSLTLQEENMLALWLYTATNMFVLHHGLHKYKYNSSHYNHWLYFCEQSWQKYTNDDETSRLCADFRCLLNELECWNSLLQYLQQKRAPQVTKQSSCPLLGWFSDIIDASCLTCHHKNPCEKWVYSHAYKHTCTTIYSMLICFR